MAQVARRARRRDRRLPRPLRLEDLARDAHRGGDARGIFTRQISTIPSCSALPPSCSTNSTSARSMPIWASRWRATRSPACARTCASSVMSATLDGARVARLLGDAPVVESEGRAFPVETRYLGRKADAPIEQQMADAIASALRADSGSVLAFLPGAAEIRRTAEFPRRARAGRQRRDRAAVRRARRRRAGPRHRARAEGHAQGGAGDLDRGDLAAASRACASWSIPASPGVPRYEPDIGLTRLETVRASRAAVDQRRGRAGRHRARRLLPALGRAADGLAGALHPAGNSPAPTCPRWCSISRNGASAIPPRCRSSIRRRGRAGRRRKSLLCRAQRARWRRPHHRGGQEPACAGAAAAAGAHDRGFRIASGEGEAAAEIAAIITERGLGGDSVDLEHRRDQFRRDRSPRAASARDLARRWAYAGGSVGEGGPQDDLSTGVMLAYAVPGPRRAQSRQWQLRARQWPRRRRRADLLARPRALHRDRRDDGHGGERPRPAGRADHPRTRSSGISPSISRAPTKISFDRGAMALRARRKRALHAITLSEATLAVSPTRRTPRASSPTD